jgi:hypothetical protein
MKIEFLPAERMHAMHHSGETVFAYEYPYEDMPEDFAAQEHVIFKKLEAALEKFGEDNIYVSYNTWADLVIRCDADIHTFGAEFVSVLLEFARTHAPDHYVSCGISDFQVTMGGFYGCFGFNHKRFLVDLELQPLWLERIRPDFEPQSWSISE